jgi:hypothetical protein
MTPTDTTIDYKVRSFLHLHSNFGYNSLGSRCTYRYLNVDTNVSQSISPSKLNFRFVGSSTVLHWEGNRSAIEVNEHLMESLFDKPLNRSGIISISYWQGLQIIETFYHYFYREACYSHLGPRSKLEHAPRRWRAPKRCPRTSSSLAITLGGQQGRPSQAGGPVLLLSASASSGSSAVVPSPTSHSTTAAPLYDSASTQLRLASLFIVDPLAPLFASR